MRNALCASFHFLVLFVVGAYVYFAAKTLRNAIWKRKNYPRLLAKCFHNLPRTCTTQEKKPNGKHMNTASFFHNTNNERYEKYMIFRVLRTLLRKFVLIFFFFNAENLEMQKKNVYFSPVFLQHCWCAVIVNDIKTF